MHTTSQDRIAANRANAQKSTGPKTPEGKAASKMNAMRHGLRSKEVLVPGENEPELTALHEWFQEDLQPMGPMEAMLVDQIVTTHWRLRRLLAAESGEIKREAQLQSANSNALPPALEETAAGCKLLQTWLSDTVLEVERDGELTQESVFHFSSRVGAVSSSVKRELHALHLRQRMDRKQEEPRRKARKQEAMTFLRENLRQLAEREAECHKKEEAAAQLPQIVAVLPGAEALQKFIRYESMLNRQLFRAMKELRTLQEKRTNPKSDQPRSERNPRAEGRSENVPNEPIKLGAPVQGSEFKVQSPEELPNEPITLDASVQSSEFEVQSSEKLPNEPILASHPSQVSHLGAQTTGDLPNEAKLPNEAMD